MNRLGRILTAAGGVLVAGAVVGFAALFAYRAGLIVGLVVGFVASIWFLTAHRPRMWWRAEALAAMGMPAAMALLYGRSLVLVVVTWPGSAPRTTGQALFSLFTLALVSAVMVAKVIVFRRFVRRDRLGMPQPGLPVTAEVAEQMRTRIRDLEEDRAAARSREAEHLALIDRLRTGRAGGRADA